MGGESWLSLLSSRRALMNGRKGVSMGSRGKRTMVLGLCLFLAWTGQDKTLASPPLLPTVC